MTSPACLRRGAPARSGRSRRSIAPFSRVCCGICVLASHAKPRTSRPRSGWRSPAYFPVSRARRTSCGRWCSRSVAGAWRTSAAYGPGAPKPLTMSASTRWRRRTIRPQRSRPAPLRDAIAQIVRLLRPDQADVVLLRIVADLSVEEVAVIVGKSAAAVRVTQHRALRRLAEQLRRSPVTPAPDAGM